MTQAAELAPPPMERPTPMPILVKVTSPVPVDNSDILSEAQLAGAASAGEDGAGGGGGGGCDTARAVQQALRNDPLVRTAVADAGPSGQGDHDVERRLGAVGRAGGQGPVGGAPGDHVESRLLVGVLPQRAMHGTVLLSLADGGTRFAIGAGAWRWSDCWV